MKAPSGLIVHSVPASVFYEMAPLSLDAEADALEGIRNALAFFFSSAEAARWRRTEIRSPKIAAS